MENRITGMAACAIVACVPTPTLAASAADSQFPERPVRLIVPVAPGGGTDLVARLMAQRLGERWGQTVVVDNRAGATGLIGLEIGARAAPDGHTLVVVSPPYLLAAQLSGKLSVARGGDFTPIARFANTVLLLSVHPGVPAKSVKELVDLARAKPRQINYASAGMGSGPHLATALFASMTGIEMTHVPYKGAGPSIPDLLSGRVQLALTAIPTVIQHVQAGRLRVLAVTGAKRAPTVPDVPTFAEAGYPRYDMSVWFGVFAPARMPPLLVARLNADLNWVMQQPEVADRFSGAGIDPAGGLSLAQFTDYVDAEVVKWNDALKAAGIQ